MRYGSLLILFVGLAAYAGSVQAFAGFVDEAQFRSINPFAVDVYTNFIAPLPNAYFFGETGYYGYNANYMREGDLWLAATPLPTSTIT